MADEFDHQTNNICSGNWWDTSRPRFDSGGSSSTTASTGINSTSNIASFGSWTARSDNNNNIDSMDSVSVSGSSNSMVFQDPTHEKLQGTDDRGGVLTDHSLQMMGLGLSSQAMDWNQSLLRSGKSEGSFRSLLQEDQHLSSNTNYDQETGMAPPLSPQQHFQWSAQQKMFSGGGEDEPSINQGLSISTSSNFQMDNSSIYESPSPSTMLLQGILGSSSHHHQQQQQQQQQHESPFDNHHRSMDYPNYVANYGMNTNDQVILPKFSHFMRSTTTTSPPKQPPHNLLHFSNNAQFWNASATTTSTTMSDHVPLSFLPHSFQQQQQFSTPPTFDEKPIKPNTSEVSNSSSVVKKSGSEISMKRPRNETSSSPLPPFKVRKEKMGDRITALQQLVSPFGKTDTASVLSEAIEYIKFLHEQVAVLSTPYMKSGAPIQHHNQSGDKSKDHDEPKQDLRSRGLCLVPISSTFPVTHETTVEFWTPTFGGTFR